MTTNCTFQCTTVNVLFGAEKPVSVKSTMGTSTMFWSVNGGKHLLHILYSFKSVFKVMYLPVVTNSVLK